MEEKINIAEILKDKPQGTKLYSPIFGKLRYEDLVPDLGEFTVVTSDNTLAKHSFRSDSRYNRHGEPLMLLPSDKMRDWRKFAWKKGDVLVSNDSDSHIIFNGFSKNDYTTFEGKHWISVSKKRHISYLNMQDTQNYHIEDNKEVAQTYINIIEKRFGGKLNLESLEIEKAQPEFKDGDIVVYGKSVAICRKIYKHTLYFYVSIDEVFGLLFGDNRVSSKEYRLATDSEKQQLFDALAKEGKAWDAERKAIVDLKPKIEFKPMDLCLMKYIGQYNSRGWELCQYAYTEHRVLASGEQRDFYHAVGGEIYAECIPYKGNEHLLGTKKI